jgi:hypothetical protein
MEADAACLAWPSCVCAGTRPEYYFGECGARSPLRAIGAPCVLPPPSTTCLPSRVSRARHRADAWSPSDDGPTDENETLAEILDGAINHSLVHVHIDAALLPDQHFRLAVGDTRPADGAVQWVGVPTNSCRRKGRGQVASSTKSRQACEDWCERPQSISQYACAKHQSTSKQVRAILSTA